MSDELTIAMREERTAVLPSDWFALLVRCARVVARMRRLSSPV